jgi:hypothetical protein
LQAGTKTDRQQVYIVVILYRHACTRHWSSTLYRLAAFTIALGTSIVYGLSLLHLISQTLTHGYRVTPQRFLDGQAFNGVLAIRAYTSTNDISLVCPKANSAVPLLNVFIFGLQTVSTAVEDKKLSHDTHQDIISVWCFWKPASNIMQDVDSAHNGADDRCERGDEGTKTG